METFEINSLLRLLRTSIRSNLCTNKPNQSTVSTGSIGGGSNSAQRLEMLKSLRRKLKQNLTVISGSSVSGMGFTNLVLSVFDVLKSILAELVQCWLSQAEMKMEDGVANRNETTMELLSTLPTHKPPPPPVTTNKPSKTSLSTEEIYQNATRRNEILEIIHIVTEVSMKISTVTNLYVDANNNNSCSNNSESHNIVQLLEDCSGRIFLPEMIALLGHDSTDVKRCSARFLQQYITRTNNLQRFMQTFVDCGLRSTNNAVQHGALSYLSYLFAKPEFRAENLSLLIVALGQLLAQTATNTSQAHLFYTTIATMEIFHHMLGSKRFLLPLHSSEVPKLSVDIYKKIQKRAPSPQHLFNTCVTDTESNRWNVDNGQLVQGGGGGDGAANPKQDNNDKEVTTTDGLINHSIWNDSGGGGGGEVYEHSNTATSDGGYDRKLTKADAKKFVEQKTLPETKANISSYHSSPFVNTPTITATGTTGVASSVNAETNTNMSSGSSSCSVSRTSRPVDNVQCHNVVCGEWDSTSVQVSRKRKSVVSFQLDSDNTTATATTTIAGGGNALTTTSASNTTTQWNNSNCDTKHQCSKSVPANVSQIGPQQKKKPTTSNSAFTQSLSTNHNGELKHCAGGVEIEYGDDEESEDDDQQDHNNVQVFNHQIDNSDQQLPVNGTVNYVLNRSSIDHKQQCNEQNNSSETSESVRVSRLESFDNCSDLSKPSENENKASVVDYKPVNHLSPPTDCASSESSVECLSKMAAATTTVTNHNYANGLNSYSNLDADTLANLDYIPTLKDYYHPYLPSYYYDLYHHVPAHGPPTTTVPPLAPVVGAHLAHYPNRHLLRFGIFPRVLVYQALSTIAEEQFAAVQSIVRVVRDAPHEHLLLLVPHMDEFLAVFVSPLLLDTASNFKVILWTLDIIELLTERLQHRLQPFLSSMVSILSQRLGDNRIVIRDSVIKVFHQMMLRYSPQEMLDLLFKHVSSGQHAHLAFTSSAKLREEMANRVTATVSTFPRAQLNLPKLCFDVAPFLLDRRALVRLAALECVASLAQALGPHKLGQLMTAVHSLDTCLTSIDLDRLVSAIQARLARRSLPRTGPDGNVQYVLRVPNSGEQPWFYRRIYDADLEWIALGPSTPPVATIPLMKKPTAFVPQPTTASSDNSSEGNDLTGDCRDQKAREEERFARQQLVSSSNSEDIPPPVNRTVVSTECGGGCGDTAATAVVQKTPRHNKHRSKSRIDPNSMANDQQNLMRNFADSQQQQEIESRCRSLERSKTSQEYRPYGGGSKQDAFLERFVRGESIDDSDLIDAQILRKSSIESLEAWRQYFGRFKKQLAEIALNVGGNRHGSRPGSDAVYGSPLPPTGLSPAYYYYYYCNGLSHSYHDLSQLQQQNMISIMKRSGFMSDDQDDSINQDGGVISPTFTKPPPDTERINQPSRSQSKLSKQHSKVGRSVGFDCSEADDGGGKTTVEIVDDNDDGRHQSQAQQPKQTSQLMDPMDSFPLERSLSMPSIGPERVNSGTGAANRGLAECMVVDGGSSQPNEEISDEVIQELGMWEQVIQEEKKESTLSNPNEANQNENQDDEHYDGGSDEGQQTPVGAASEQTHVEEVESKLSPAVRFEEKSESNESLNRHSSVCEESDKSEMNKMVDRQKRKQSVIPVVNIQQPTPIVTADSEYGRNESPNEYNDDDNDDHQRRESLKQTEMDGQVSDDSESKTTEEPMDNENVSDNQKLKEEEVAAQAKSDDDKSDEKESTDQVDVATQPKRVGKKVGVSGASKPPPARRLSRIPQQLYIKTTPAIPANANIQHILANVARTEGPFEYPAEAVKAAVIALHDNAWTTKVEGMLAIARLAAFHPHYLLRDQHQIALALVAEVRNLRSTVSRSAIFTIGELFAKLKSQIEPELDILSQALLYKVGENSIFIREDIDRALSLMIQSMPQTRAAISLITYGSNHRNTYVRRTCSQFLSMLVEKMGPMKCLLGPREIGEHLLPAAARFIQDGSPHTRYFGRRIFAVLMQHPSFDKLLRKHVSPGTYRNILGMLETIKRRGVGDRPADLLPSNTQTANSGKPKIQTTVVNR